MADERQDVQGPGVDSVSAPGLVDDDPTLETVTPEKDDEPTLETMTDATGEAPAQQTEPAKATGWGRRLEQMTVAKLERRRLVVTRFWLAGAPVLILVVVAMILLAVYGGQGGGDSAVNTTTTVAQQKVEGSGLMLVDKDGALSWAVMMQPGDSGGVVLTVPSNTLLESQGAFKTLAEMYQTGQEGVVEAALAGAFDLPVGPAVVVEWSDLQAAMAAAGAEGVSSPAVATSAGEAEAVAQAVRALVGEYKSDGSSDPWKLMRMQGETADFLRAVQLDAVSMAASAWTAAALGGSAVAGDGFNYLEPDLVAAKSLLVVAVQPTALGLEIKDGAGIDGAARRAGSLLESGGFALLPMSYAGGYPGVEKTQIAASPEAAEKARQVQSVLGMGEIVEDKTLASDRIVVILGKDFGTGSPAVTQGT